MVESMLLDGFYFFSNLVVVSGFSDLFSISIALFCLFFFSFDYWFTLVLGVSCVNFFSFRTGSNRISSGSHDIFRLLFSYF